MKTIHKFILGSHPCILMPQGAIVRHVNVQRDDICLWAEVNASPDIVKVERYFHVYGTGHELLPNPGVYHGTVMLAGGSFVFHIYELCPPQVTA